MSGDGGKTWGDEPSSDVPVADRPAADASKLATEAAFAAWPDQTEPFEFEGHKLQRIVADHGPLRYAFVMGAAWQRGESWAQPKIAHAPEDTSPSTLVGGSELKDTPPCLTTQRS